jgi:hypothetical protein
MGGWVGGQKVQGGDQLAVFQMQQLSFLIHTISCHSANNASLLTTCWAAPLQALQHMSIGGLHAPAHHYMHKSSVPTTHTIVCVPTGNTNMNCAVSHLGPCASPSAW